MKEFVQYVITVLVVVGLLRVIRIYYPAMAAPSSLALVVGLTGVSLAAFLPVVEYINYIAEQYSVGYLTVLWKSLAISILSATSADICRAADEIAVAEKVELLGKCELLVLSLPLIQDLVELVMKLSESAL